MSKLYHTAAEIIATLDRLGINPTPKPERITIEGERQKLLPNWKPDEDKEKQKPSRNV